MKRLRCDDGTVMLLALASILIVLTAALVFFDASALYMRRNALLMHADNAAIAAAQAIDVAALYDNTVRIDPGLAQERVAASVSGVSDDRLRDIRVDSVQVLDREVVVSLSARVPAPLSRISGQRDVRIRASASAMCATGP